MILNSPSSKISYQIERQFPAIYREEARELIMLVEEYYKFLESVNNQSIYHQRRMREYIDIDRTMQSMLIFYQNKYLDGLPLNEQSVRFTVKNILDLYRRKGSEEGIRLFFQLFYDEAIEIFYPSEAMLKPSTSRWQVGAFLQLHPEQNPLAFSGLVGLKIYGSLSKAEAFVDSVQFVNVYGSIIPIIFLDRAKGQFIGLETIFTTEPDRRNYGRVYGSMGLITDVVGVTADNKIGDVVAVTAPKGFGGKAVVTRVSTTVSGEVTFEILDGDFGYSVFNANTNPFSNSEIILSNQNLLFPNANLDFVIEERISQFNEDANTEFFATVIGQSAAGLGIVLDNVAEPFVSGPFETLDRVTSGLTINVVSLAVDPSDSAYAEVGVVDNEQTIEIATDLLSNYLTVALNDANYSVAGDVPMSGGIGVDLTTPFNEAFAPEEVVIGRITELRNIFPGVDYNNNAYVLVKDHNVAQFKHKNQILEYRDIGSVVQILIGDIIQQEKEVIRYDGSTENIIVQGKVTAISGPYIYLKLRSFWPFNFGEDIFRVGSTIPLTINAFFFNDEPLVTGLNAVISADADFALGRIEAVKVINSGIAYQDLGAVVLHNETMDADPLRNNLRTGEELDSLGTAQVRYQGITEGRWLTKTSHVGFADGKRIQDSDFYQDFSYEVATSLNETEYLEELRDLAHPAGVKLFTKFALFERINTSIEISSEIEEII